MEAMKKNPLFERMLVNYDNLTDFVKSSENPRSLRKHAGESWWKA